MRKSPLDQYLVLPIKKFIEKQTSVGILLIFAALLAMLVANSPLAEAYHHLWEQHIHIGINDFVINKSILHWINDGLMSMFFFLIGLEIKKEILHGELSSFRGALLPLTAGIGGMMMPAIIFSLFNSGTPAIEGWGIPMATDIAFALGLLYLLGDKVPLSLKIFLTAIAVIDDLGAVLIIALFYTSDISLLNLGIAAVFLSILVFANYIGVRNTIFYMIVGIGGLWLAILLSGVHATIAAVLAALAIPNSRIVDPPLFLRKVKLWAFQITKNEDPELTSSNVETGVIIEKFALLTKEATPPLQRLENGLTNFVNFVVLPLFAFANAGVTINADSFGFFLSPITIGIILGLIIGKFCGIVFFTRLLCAIKICKLPKGVTWKHIYGVGCLGGIGFTMSLFITELAFDKPEMLTQAKIGILTASILAGIIGYNYLNWVSKRK